MTNVLKNKKSETASGDVVKTLSAKNLSERGQVDILYRQIMRDGSYRFILYYMEYLTKFSQVSP